MSLLRRALLIVLVAMLVLAGLRPALPAAMAQVGPACHLLDDPAVRRRMSAPFEEALLQLCGWAPVPAAGAPRARLPIPGGILLGPDVRVNAVDLPGSPSAVQSETSIAVNRNNGTICAAWNDRYHWYGEGTSYIGFARSTDGGQTFTDGGSMPPYAGGRARGDPSLAWRAFDGYFYFTSIFLIAGGQMQLGLWRSTDDCATFQWVGLVHAGSSDDKELMAIDNNPDSPHYGRFYVTWMNFGGGGLSVTYSDNGISWSTPVVLSSDSVQGPWPAVDPTPSGDVYVAWLRWGYSDLNYIEVARSTDGGQSFSRVQDAASGVINPYDEQASNNCGRDALKANADDGIRYLPSPQIVVGPDRCLHVVYSYDPDGHNVGDVVDSFYRRSCTFGATWEAEHRLNDDATTTDQFFPAITVNADNVVAASWYDRRLDPANNWYFDRYMAISTDGGTTWGPNQRVSDVSSPVWIDDLPAYCYHGDYDQMESTPTAIYVLWSDDRDFYGGHNDSDIYLDQERLACDPVQGAEFTWEPLTPTVGQELTFTGTVFSMAGWITQTVDSAYGTGFNTSLALDANGSPHLSYQDWNQGTLKYAHYDGSAWLIETVDQGSPGSSDALALDAAGFPHVGYMSGFPGFDLKYAWYDGSGWISETVDSAGDAGYHASLALDAAGHPHISYYVAWPAYDLRYAWYNGTSWVIETVDSAGDVGEWSSLALDSAGYPHIAYTVLGASGELRYARYDGTGWVIETVASAEMGGSPSLVLDILNRPHISYYDFNSAMLNYAYHDGSSWHFEVVDGNGAGHYGSLALDGFGRPHISYYDDFHNDLRYAWYDGAAWITETVDSAGIVGLYTSLALGRFNRPHISYYDETHDNLRFAWPPLIPTPPISYAWDFGDGSPAVVGPSAIVTHTYAQAGLYTVAMTATNCAAATATAAHTITVVQPCDPVHGADFSWTPPVPLAGQVVTLTGAASGTLPITYTWSFGDGSSLVVGPSSIVTHTYAVPGPYTVVLTASNCATATARAAHTITVVQPCEAVHDAAFVWLPITPTVGEAVVFTGTASGTLPITYTWNFGDGSPIVRGPSSVVSHTYDLPGLYAVSMTATNCATATATASGTLTVLPSCQGAHILSVTTTVTGCVAALEAEVDGSEPIAYLWQSGAMSSTMPSVVWDFQATGTYSVTLEVWNCGGAGHDRRAFAVTVECRPTWQIYLPLVWKG